MVDENSEIMPEEAADAPAAETVAEAPEAPEVPEAVEVPEAPEPPAAAPPAPDVVVAQATAPVPPAPEPPPGPAPAAPVPAPPAASATPRRPHAPAVASDKSKVAAGVFGILLGSLGVHKFYLGYTKEGIIMLPVSVLSFGFLAVDSRHRRARGGHPLPDEDRR